MSKSPSTLVLERIVLEKTIQRAGRDTLVYVVAEAWDGKEIKGAIERFLGLAAGGMPESLTVTSKGRSLTLRTGGAAHIVAYVRHDGLMDFSLQSVPQGKGNSDSRSSIVLACASQAFFSDLLKVGGSHTVLLTTGLMAPEGCMSMPTVG